MHPIEHLRYVARARGADPTELVREAASALGSLRADGAELVIACRRIVERHPDVGPLWWLASRLLVADEPSRTAWDLADEADDERPARTIAAALPDDAIVVTIGWPSVAGAALARRGDATVLCADSRHEASSFMQRLERSDVACEPLPFESLARAIASADLVMVEGVAACPTRILAPIGSHVVAAVAASLGVPVWCALGVGRRLPVEYVDEIASRVMVGSASASVCDLEIDDLPLGLVTHVASIAGVTDDLTAALRPECAYTPELMRSSPI